MRTSEQPGTVAWTELKLELDRWSEAGKTATFWWRDDDAIDETPQLRTLDALSTEMKVPVSLAVIPAHLQNSLANYLQQRDNFIAVQHGYSHSSYAAQGAKNIELGGKRSTDEIRSELASGQLRLRSVLGEQFLSVMVPPWNRIDSRIVLSLVSAGFSGVSTMWARQAAYPIKGLLQVNAHFDPINWRHDRGFIGDASAIEQILRHLSARRIENGDISEPTGILTHHLVQSDEVWQFCRKLFAMLNRHPAVHWLDAREIWSAN